MSFVYLAENQRHDVMKIGVSFDPMKRLPSLKASASYCSLKRHHQRFRLIRILPGDRTVEQQLLRAARHLRFKEHGEWLRHSAEVMDIFDALGARTVKTDYRPYRHYDEIPKRKAA